MAERTYSYKDVDMLTASQTMVKHFKQHQADIEAMRATWADPFITDLEAKINNAISTYLGLDPKKDQRLATLTLLELQAKALKDLALFKVNIEADYATDTNRLNWLLTNLGFNAHHTAAQKGDQEALVQLLQQYKLNMTADLKTEITAKGTNEALIDGIIAQADPIQTANTEQETLKASSKELTDEAVKEFNEIYAQMMAIAKITAKLYKADKVKQQKFVFSKLVSALSIRTEVQNKKNNG